MVEEEDFIGQVLGAYFLDGQFQTARQAKRGRAAVSLTGLVALQLNRLLRSIMRAIISLVGWQTLGHRHVHIFAWLGPTAIWPQRTVIEPSDNSSGSETADPGIAMF